MFLLAKQEETVGIKAGNGLGLSPLVLEAVRMQKQFAAIAPYAEAMALRDKLEKFAPIDALVDDYSRLEKQLSSILAPLAGRSSALTGAIGSEYFANFAAQYGAFPKHSFALSDSVSQQFITALSPAQDAIARGVLGLRDNLTGVEAAFGALGLEELQAIGITLGQAYEAAHGEHPDADALPAIDLTDDEREQRKFLAAFIVSALLAFWNNSRKDASNFGLMDLIAVVGLLLGIVPFLQAPDFNPQDRQALEAAASDLAKIAEGLEADRGNSELLAELPRTILERKARLRAGPSRYASLVATLPEGTEVAIAGRDGDWHEVIYRSELTDAFDRGWVYRSAPPRSGVTPLR
jgi:hypothetical protein